MMLKMMESFPVGRLSTFGVGIDKAQLEQLLAAANAAG